MTTTELTTREQIDPRALFSLVSGGDCSTLTDQQKLSYYRARCEASKLDPRTAPFEFIKMNGKLVLYAKKEAAQQLAANHGIVVEVVSQQTEDGIRTVTVRARSKDGRQTDEIGCVTVGGLKGDALCNAYMKAVTKAKRRAVLAICGLGMLDESELETVPSVETPLVEPRRKSEATKPKHEPVQILDAEMDKPPVESMTPPEDDPAPEPKKATKNVTKKKAVAPKANNLEWADYTILKMGKESNGTKKNGEPWTRWSFLVKSGDGPDEWMSTFSSTCMEAMEAARIDGSELAIGCRSAGKYKTAEEIGDPASSIPDEDVPF